MAYTCAVYPDADATLEEAQFEKFDLVCRKLGLEPGMRLLDVGCGWGGMVVHAAAHYGVEALGVTLSREQAEWGRRAVDEAGLADRAEVRHLDYRDVTESGFDAISSIGLTEHVGEDQLPDYFAFLHGKLRPQGRLLNHCITRANNQHPRCCGTASSTATSSPTASCWAPATWRRGCTTRASSCATRRTCASTTRARSRRGATTSRTTGTRRWPRSARPGRALAALPGRLAGVVRRDYIELHQVLGVKTEQGESGMPLRPDWGAGGRPRWRGPRGLSC